MKSSTSIAIAEFCETGSGTTPSRQRSDEYFGGTIPWVKSGELKETEITHTEECVTEKAIAETSLKRVPPGALLVAMYGATVGRVGILGIEATTNQAVCYIVPDPKRADKRYLFHALQYKASELVARGVGGAQPNITQGIVRETKIFLPALVEQRKIAVILDAAAALRAKRRDALTKLDSLAQSIFIEMFGAQTDDKGFPIVCLADACKRITDGTHQPPKWSATGVPFIFVSNVRHRTIDLETSKFVSQETYSELTRNCPIEIGDVLYTAVGSYGNAAEIHKSDRFVFQRHIAQIKPDRRKLNSTFLVALLESPALRRQADRVAKGVAQKTVTLGDLARLDIQLPPLGLQKSFAQRVARLDKLKAAHLNSLRVFDGLFISLQNSAFQGEL